MFSISKSFANCNDCSLKECASCILDTNCVEDLSKVEIVFVAENPGKVEVKFGKPLIGTAGKLFRKYFDAYFKNYFRYLITNTVLCQTLNKDDTTGNPSWYTIERCRINCFNLIDTCNPNLIFVMGGSAMRAFNIAKVGVLNKRSKLYKWKNFDIFLTVHPSFVSMFGDNEFENDFVRAKKILISKLAEKRMIKLDRISYKDFFKKNFTINKMERN